eukprot:m.22259 g.22259  ORF g.22259 m.22259 type:complete len:513 (-) comp12648_c0_seq4:329-1867(-)
MPAIMAPTSRAIRAQPQKLPYHLVGLLCVHSAICQIDAMLSASDPTRPMPGWDYNYVPRGGVSGVAWFGANRSGFENSSQLEMLGNYSMVVFGWQALLEGPSNYTGELDLLVEQCQIVKHLHPRTTVIVYIDGLRVQPFYSVLRTIMRDPAYEDFFLRDASGFIPATTYCKQMGQPAMDPKCLCWYWNWFNASAVDFYINRLILPQVQKSRFDGVFFDGSDGFLRGTWKSATNVAPGTTSEDALKAMVAVHMRVANTVYAQGKYAIFSEHLSDSTPDQHAYIATSMASTPYARFYEDFQPTISYINNILNETQPRATSAVPALPIIVHQSLKGDENITTSIATFLLLQSNFSYFMASTGWFDKDWTWHTEYDPQYGLPLGPAAQPYPGVYVRNFSRCDVTVDCSSGGDINVEISPDADPLLGVEAWNCSLFDCSCQGFADYYGTEAGHGFGCAPSHARDWWRARACAASSTRGCCNGPACLLPGHSPCTCPHTGPCRGSIAAKSSGELAGQR